MHIVLPCAVTPAVGADKSSDKRLAIKVSWDGITVGACTVFDVPLGRLTESLVSTIARVTLKYLSQS